MSEEPCFGDYWNAVDAVLLKLYGIDTMDIDPLTADMIAQAEEDGWTPEEIRAVALRGIWPHADHGPEHAPRLEECRPVALSVWLAIDRFRHASFYAALCGAGSSLQLRHRIPDLQGQSLASVLAVRFQ
jgi:hypothetical protein